MSRCETYMPQGSEGVGLLVEKLGVVVDAVSEDMLVVVLVVVLIE